MSQLVCDNDLFEELCARGLLQELVDWWRANGLEPHYANEPVTIETDPEGRRTIHYTTPIDRDAIGAWRSTSPRSAPLLVEPPDHWPHRGDAGSSPRT